MNRNDPLGGCIGLIVILAVLIGLAAWGVTAALDKLEDVKQADAAVEQQHTLQQQNYYAFLAAMAAMGQDTRGSDGWLVGLVVLDLVLGGACVYVTKRGKS